MIRVRGDNSRGQALAAEQIAVVMIEANKLALPKNDTFEITRDNIGELPLHYLVDYVTERELYEIGDMNKVIKPVGPFKAALLKESNLKLYVGISVKDVSKISKLDADGIESALDFIVYKNFPTGLFGEDGDSKNRVHFVDCFLPEERRTTDNKLRHLVKQILV